MYAAALSKVTLGTGILTQRLFAEVLSTQRLVEVTSPALLAAAEWTDTLVGDTEVCAGSEKMIALFLDALFGPARAAEGTGQVAGIVARQGAAQPPGQPAEQPVALGA